MSAPTDTAALSEKALRAARTFIRNGVEYGYIRMPDADTPDSAHDTLPLVERALAALAASAQPVVAVREAAWMSAFDDARDAILNDRGPLEGEGMTSDQTNAVLAILDQHLMPHLQRGERASMPIWRGQMPPDFLDYVKRNYNGEVVFSDPLWHAVRLWRAAMKSLADREIAAPKVEAPVVAEGWVMVPKETLSRWRKWCLGYEWPKVQDWDSGDVYLAIADEIRTKYEGAAPKAAGGQAMGEQ